MSVFCFSHIQMQLSFCAFIPLLVCCAGQPSFNGWLVFVSLYRPIPELVRDVREGNWLRFGPGKLRELCKLLPEDTEVTISQLYYHCLSSESIQLN